MNPSRVRVKGSRSLSIPRGPKQRNSPQPWHWRAVRPLALGILSLSLKHRFGFQPGLGKEQFHCTRVLSIPSLPGRFFQLRFIFQPGPDFGLLGSWLCKVFAYLALAWKGWCRNKKDPCPKTRLLEATSQDQHLKVFLSGPKWASSRGIRI